MARYKVEPVPGYEADVLADYTALPLRCADGFAVIMDILEENEPSINDRCGLIADQYELYAIPLPDCVKRAMIMSVDRKDDTSPRAVHGTRVVSDTICDLGAQLAISQYGLTNPSWET